MEVKDGIKAVPASNTDKWRQWLSANHSSEKGIWLIIYKKDSGIPSITYDQAVDEALCFGWIDSKPNKRDQDSIYQYFAKRNPKSNWSKVNKEKVARLTAANKMQMAGLEMVDHAKAIGTWDALNDVDNLVIPQDLAEALADYDSATANFEAFPKSVKRGILEWIFNAKRSETRKKRITETARLAQENIRANQFR